MLHWHSVHSAIAPESRICSAMRESMMQTSAIEQETERPYFHSVLALFDYCPFNSILSFLSFVRFLYLLTKHLTSHMPTNNWLGAVG